MEILLFRHEIKTTPYLVFYNFNLSLSIANNNNDNDNDNATLRDETINS